jgi:hypothetical protein
MVINLLLILTILFECYLAYTALYLNLDPQAEAVVLNKIVKVDLNAYKTTTNLIQLRVDFKPGIRDLINPNPFKYNQ